MPVLAPTNEQRTESGTTSRVGALNTAQAAEYLGGLSKRTLEGWRTRGLGPVPTPLGDSIQSPVVYRIEDLDAWLLERRNTGRRPGGR